MQQPVQIDSNFIESTTSFIELVKELDSAFSNNTTIVPKRHHHHFPNPEVKEESTLLIMPAWKPSEDAGIKIVTVSPKNEMFELPSIQGSYLYLDATTGLLKAIIEAKSLTVKRTAATSALASSFLSKKSASTLLMIGTGALSVNLIQAHAAVRPIKKVFVWGRTSTKAKLIAEKLNGEKIEVKAVSKIASVISKVDIVSCATLSKTPLVLGKYLRKGQHVDLVGAYRPNMREADNETIKKASIFIDSYSGGLNESGDILIPLKEGIISKDEIKAELFQLCSKQKKGRIDDDEITVFKSVGHALEDLVAARYYFNKMND
ncbi:ornithine cyclodeaminase family protein [Croceitalea sp. P059]|uniref:ornithine cyclodeaminase family protein n=1 Tax=Croceitalea sp. P059 TaxID=3075601 RepID=UPI0028862C38|nr:ornithine cyclodeaminase family protein [Croceitalea sp. P059]MDT0539431.1 ornithine cyclodeaminase family protein [Croceitalea sp. P059]